MKILKGLLKKNIDYIVVFILLFFLFNYLVPNIGSDYGLHLKSIKLVNNGEANYSPHFFFFFLVNLLSGFSNNMELMYDVTIILLAVATLFKYFISKLLIKEYNTYVKHRYSNRVITVLSFALLFCFAIPDFYNFFVLKFMYLGRLTPNVWHNSTITLLFPFSLLLFRQHLISERIENPKLLSVNTFSMIFLILLNIITKPSFIFVFFPVAVLIIVNQFQFAQIKKALIKLVPIIVGSLFLLIQYMSIYKYQIGSFDKEASSVGIGIPFEFIRYYIPTWYAAISLLFSMLFPIAAIHYYKEILKFRPFLYSFLYTIVGILISIFIIEEGPRKYHGNFGWQTTICMYLLLLSIVTYLFPKLFTKEIFSNKMIVLGSIFILHFLSGILYFIKMYYTGAFS